MRELRLIPRQIATAMIVGYQKTLSPDHGLLRGRYPYGFCRYYPSCSEYSKIAITKHGVLRGGLQAVWRIVRCNPFTHPQIELNH